MCLHSPCLCELVEEDTRNCFVMAGRLLPITGEEEDVQRLSLRYKRRQESRFRAPAKLQFLRQLVPLLSFAAVSPSAAVAVATLSSYS